MKIKCDEIVHTHQARDPRCWEVDSIEAIPGLELIKEFEDKELFSAWSVQAIKWSDTCYRVVAQMKNDLPNRYVMLLIDAPAGAREQIENLLTKTGACAM